MEKPPHVEKAGVELDKFKRRLIRAIARLLIQQKRPEEEIWKELKKETGCDCKLLWARMRALTLKKLDRLFLANDNWDAVPAPARMTLTDWLMFDLVLVHQDLDLIGQEQENLKGNKEDHQVLVELLKIVKLFSIENLRGDDLAEAWSLATIYYNNRGHQVSPMLLQRRWYQLRKATRDKFYNFWFAYRGNTTRIAQSQEFKPTPLETDIAATYKRLVIDKFIEWDKMIELRLITMPEEFEEKQERAARSKPAKRKSSVEAPDLVMIEPRIETIDLRLEQDDNAAEQDKQEEEGFPVPGLVRIKQEPTDEMEEDETPPEPPKKSMFEVVLESTALENLQIDSMDAEANNQEKNDNHIEEDTVTDKEDSVMPRIGSVFGNVTDTSIIANIDEDRTYANIENDASNSVVNADDTNISNDINTGIPETITVDNAEAKVDNVDIIIDNIARNNDQVIEIGSDDKDDVVNIENNQGTVRDPSPDAGDNIPEDINEISDDDDGISGNDDSSNILGRIDETSVVGNVVESSVSGNVDKAGVFGSVEATNIISIVDVTDTNSSGDEISMTSHNKDGTQPVTNENIPNIDVSKTEISNSTVNETADVMKDVEIIDNDSKPVVIIDSDEEEDIVDDLITFKDQKTVPKSIIDQPKEVETPKILEVTSTEPLIVSGVEKTIEVVKKEEKFFGFEELPAGLVFADEGIEIVDNGEAYFGEDSSNESDIEGNEADEDTPKIDAKLLLYPIVYTTRLDSMGLFRTQPFDHINDKLLLDAITKRSKPIIKQTIDNNSCDENIKKETVNDNKETIECVPINAYSIDTLIVKEEPLNVSETIFPQDQTVPIEFKTENDDIVPSADSDSDDSIDESLKVKRTSYLLRKPRSRRYNPIQLCKNPDFNTRLKRLSVGFFSSPRNRVLIKSCKPLTIDLSKTFESKLISGTLYLKPADHDVKTEIEIIDDTESHSVSVVPSAMPAQSLIDNSNKADIIPMIRQCLEASKQPIDVARMSERNTVINLPDISEIRRINQRLLTAEVTPIQVQNNQPQVPVTIVTSPISPTPPPVPGPQRTVTTAETVQDSRPIEPQANNLIRSIDSIITRNNQIVQNIDDLRAVTPKGYIPPSREIRPDLRFTDGYRPRNTVITGRPPRFVNGKRFFPPKSLPWKPRQFRPEIPWLTKNYKATQIERCDETLLTLDALNKMLRLLTDEKKPTVVPPKKKKRKNAGQQTSPQHGRPVRRCDHSSNIVAGENEPVSSEEVVIEEPVTSEELVIEEPVPFEEPVTSEKLATSEDPVTSEEPVTLTERKKNNTKRQNPRFYVKSAANSYPPVPKRGRKVDAGCEEPNKAMEYCCWARHRMLQLLFKRDHIPAHGCTRRCMCCCRQLLHDYYRKRDTVQDEEVQGNELQIIKAPNPKGIASNVTLVTGGKRLSVNAKPMYARETPTGTASVRVPPLESDQIVIDLEASNTHGNTNENDLEFLSDQAVGVHLPVPRLGGEVSVSTSAVVPPPAIRGPEIPNTVRRKFVSVSTSENHNLISGVPAEAATPSHQNISISSDNQSKVAILNAIKTPTATISPNKISPYNLIKLLADKKPKAQNTTNTSVPPLIKNTFETPKNIREKIIFLNSKQISEKPTACPLHLGKNKILLTTIKFPFNLKYFNDAKKALEPSFKLPTGVHIILLPDATVSYRIDPNVEVTATDMTEMPEYLAAMRAHMERGAAQEQALNILNVPATPAVTTGEVVDLIDNDDDGSAPNVNENDKGTPLVANVLTNEENVTVNNEGSPIVTPIAQMNTADEIEENRTDSSISTNVVATESSQNVNQNTVIDIQENIQESTKNEMLSASTGQLQGHPDPSNKVSADVDSSQIKSTDVQEVSAEQPEDQPISSSQHVNGEIDLAKTLNQIESSHVNEVLTEQTKAQSDEVLTEKTEVQSEISGQNTTIEVQDLPEPATQKASTEVPAESVSEPSKPKPKNILSDLMEMSGIFDEDMTPPENGQTAVPVQGTVLPSTDPPSQGSTILQPMLIPGALSPPQPVVPKIQSPIGELTPITSLYELKYACANKGVFFKLDMENGYLVPINVCMKGITQQAPMPRTLLRNIAPKSVIDLTEDDIPAQQSTDPSPEPSPSKRSLLLVNNLSGDDSAAGPVSKPSAFTGPARPVKLFKALKPSILQRLNLNKINQNIKNVTSSILDHTRKRKQFLRKINMNADSDADVESAELNSPVLMRPFLKKITLRKRELMYKGQIRADNEPVATTSRTEPRKQFATTILSDDSSDDEPLSKIAKKKNENIAPKSVPMEIDSFSLTVAEGGKIVLERQAPVREQTESELPVAEGGKIVLERQAPVREQIESELPVANIGNVTMNDVDNMDKQAPVDKQNESELPENNEEHMSGDDSDSQANELPAADTSETFYVSDADNDFIDPDAPFGFNVDESDDEDEGHCILGV